MQRSASYDRRSGGVASNVTPCGYAGRVSNHVSASRQGTDATDGGGADTDSGGGDAMQRSATDDERSGGGASNVTPCCYAGRVSNHVSASRQGTDATAGGSADTDDSSSSGGTDDMLPASMFSVSHGGNLQMPAAGALSEPARPILSSMTVATNADRCWIRMVTIVRAFSEARRCHRWTATVRGDKGMSAFAFTAATMHKARKNATIDENGVQQGLIGAANCFNITWEAHHKSRPYTYGGAIAVDALVRSMRDVVAFYCGVHPDVTNSVIFMSTLDSVLLPSVAGCRDVSSQLFQAYFRIFAKLEGFFKPIDSLGRGRLSRRSFLAKRPARTRWQHLSRRLPSVARVFKEGGNCYLRLRKDDCDDRDDMIPEGEPLPTPKLAWCFPSYDIDVARLDVDLSSSSSSMTLGSCDIGACWNDWSWFAYPSYHGDDHGSVSHGSHAWN